MKLYRFDFKNKTVEIKEIAYEEGAMSYAKKSGGYVRKNNLNKVQGGSSFHMYSHSPDPCFFIRELQKKFEAENKRYLKKIKENKNNLEYLQNFLEKSGIPQSKILSVEEYFDTVNLGDYDLEGCEFTEDDFDTIKKRWHSGGEKLETVVHDYLLEIREVLDAGLDDEDFSDSEDN